MTDTVSHVQAAPWSASRPGLLTAALRYANHDLRRHLRMWAALFFTIVMPSAMYLMFGAMTDYGDYPVGSSGANVQGTIMTSMAVYGAILATSSTAGSAAVEQSQGWGRQLGLTPMRTSSYAIAKVVVGFALSALPVALVFLVAGLTGARLGSVETWISTFVLAIVCSSVFSLYGLAFGMWFRSESAMAASSGVLVLLGFFGNLFMPLSGALLEIAKFTPVYGIAGLAQWPVLEGARLGEMPDPGHDPLWLLLANVIGWTVVFAVLCLAAARRRTRRQ